MRVAREAAIAVRLHNFAVDPLHTLETLNPKSCKECHVGMDVSESLGFPLPSTQSMKMQTSPSHAKAWNS